VEGEGGGLLLDVVTSTGAVDSIRHSVLSSGYFKRVFAAPEHGAASSSQPSDYFTVREFIPFRGVLDICALSMQGSFLG
jgi:hypothetical protein